jgi:hypothetical protein
MSVSLNGKKSILHKLVFELRYSYGFTYLDCCGRTLNVLLRQLPEWFPRDDQVSPQNAPLVSARNGAVLSFSARKLDLSLERALGKEPISDDEVKAFVSQVDECTAIVVDQLGLKEFTRIGFRVWLLFSAASKDETEKWLLDLKWYNISSKLTNAFGASEPAAVGAGIVLKSDDRSFRIGFNGVERQMQVDLGEGVLSVRPSSLPKGQREHLIKQQQVKKLKIENPLFGAMIDIDAYQDDPDPKTLNPGDFIGTSLERIYNNLRTAAQT